MARGMAKRSTPIIVVTQQDIPSILVPSEFFGSTPIIIVTQQKEYWTTKEIGVLSTLIIVVTQPVLWL